MAEVLPSSTPEDLIEAPILRLPPEIRLRIYSYVHEDATITIHDVDTITVMPVRRQNLYRLRDNSTDEIRFALECKNYDWKYLLTCRTFNHEARQALSTTLHLRILSPHFRIENIPNDVARRYLPHIPTLTIASRYPVYDCRFDGGKLSSLRKFYLLDENCRSRSVEHYVIADQVHQYHLAVVQGCHDDIFIRRGVVKLELSRLNWWQNDQKLWLHHVLSYDAQRSFQLILQQHMFLRFTKQTSSRTTHKWIMLVCLDIPPVYHAQCGPLTSLQDLLFDFDTKTLVRRTIRVAGPLQELRNESQIRSFLLDKNQFSRSSVEPFILTTGL